MNEFSKNFKNWLLFAQLLIVWYPNVVVLQQDDFGCSSLPRPRVQIISMMEGQEEEERRKDEVHRKKRRYETSVR